MRSTFALLALLSSASCAAPPPAPARLPEVRTWGSMREALKLGHSEGRVSLTEAIHPTATGIGALAGLAGEVTVVDGEVFLAQLVDGEMQVRMADDEDQATLLVVADVAAWSSHRLPPCGSYAELEEAIAGILEARGFAMDEPLPFRVTGTAKAVEMHVINGSCPIANPSGKSPWRFHGGDMSIELVGFFADGAAGELTHHDRRSHVHALTPGRHDTGHLDEVVLRAGAELWLPQ
jgi:alpha-acetolactate decarboxylase